MKRWPTRPLGEVATVVRGVSFDKSQVSSEPRVDWVPILRAGNIQESLLTDSDLVYVPDELVSNEQRMRYGDLAICMSSGSPAIVGKTAHLATEWRGSVGAFCAIVRFNTSLQHRFGSYWFRSPAFLQWRNSNAKGANIQNLRRAELEKLTVPVPPLAEQERIVKLLDEADELRKLRAQADRRTADFIPALFDEMFGDPATNPKHWPKCRLRELGARFSDGPFGSNLKSSHYERKGVRVIRLQNIGVGRFVDDDKAYISPEHFNSLSKHQCLPGDVLVGTLGDPNLRACVLPKEIPTALNKADCVQIRPNPQIANAAFICWLLNLPSTLQMASGMILGQTRARISMGRLAELFVPIPPLPLQTEFAQRVGEFRALEAEQAASRRRLEGLFQSLLHRAFNGEL